VTDLDKRLSAIPVQYAELEFGQLAYRDSGSGPLVVFLHGIGSGSASWVRQFEGLADDYRCIAWDAPGYGESNALAVDAPSVSDYVTVLRDWLRTIHVRDYHLVAHSLGALTAGAHCQSDIELPRTLTFIDPTLGYGARPESERTEMIDRRMRMFDELGATKLAEERGPTLLSRSAPAEALEIVRWNMSRLHRVGYHHAIRMLADTDLLARVGAIGIPVTVMCGTADEITSEALSQRLAAAYRGASYVPIEGCGHASYVEGAAVVNQHLRNQFESADEAALMPPTNCGAGN